jgi:amidophosphoribosyltransferase
MMVQVAENAAKTPVRLGGFQKPALRRADIRTLARRRVRAGFDSAETTDHNRRHWARADALSADGSHRIFKRPMRAHELVYEKPFQELLGQVDNETTILMGHTRWRTRGNEFNNRNNHPIRAGIVIGTHNGTIYNADYLFRRLGLPRYAEVDSELIFRLADRFAPEGPIDQEGLKKALALCRGQMSAVLASRLDPGTITVLKGNKPLCLRIHRQHRVVLYASDDAFIDFAVDKEKGWRELEVPPMTMLTIRHEDVRAIENSEFRFIPQERKGTRD